MNEERSTWQSTLEFVWPHPSEVRFLMLKAEAGWSLPAVQLQTHVWEADINEIGPAARSRLGVSAMIVVRCLTYRQDEAQKEASLISLLENHQTDWQLPADGAWIDRPTLAQLTLGQPEQRQVLETYLTEVETGIVPAARSPWAQPGWLAEVEPWIERELEPLGYKLTAPVEPIKHWGLSSILRVSTNVGPVYFKATATLPLFVCEPRVMRDLAALLPDDIPAPLAADFDRNWMILPDVGRPLDSDDEPPATKVKIFDCFARIQRGMADKSADLLAMGCHDRRLPRLASQVDWLLAESDALAGLDAAERDHFEQTAPRLKAICAELDGYGIPPTLVHGDLHRGNVSLQDGHYRFFDWSDACLAHPFVDTLGIYFEEDAALQAECLEAYLTHWTSYESPEYLRRAWQLAEPLAMLHQAVSYHSILSNLEPSARHGLYSALPFFLRKTMEAVKRCQGEPEHV